jgi:hypothetical protein
MRRGILPTIAVSVLWALVIVVGAVLTVQRYRAALEGANGADLGVFVQAAADVRAGRSPWTQPAYVYSPLLAWMLTPFPSLAAAAPVWAGVSLAACWATVAAVVATFWRMLRPWQRPALALLGVATILYDQVLDYELFLGQIDTLVLLATALTVLLSSLRLPVSAGVALAVGALLKTWPLALALWGLRRGAVHRARGLIGLAGAIVLVVLVELVVGGPAELGRWAGNTVALSQQPLLAYSVWGVDRFLFSANPAMPPIADAPVVGAVISIALALVVIALAVIVLRRPGSASLAMWNLGGVVVLLLPVSHLSYRFLMLPLLWVWAVHAVRTRRVGAIVAAGAMVLFWLLTFRTPWLDPRHSGNDLQLAALIVGAVAALAVSVVVAARGDRDGTFAEVPLRAADPEAVTASSRRPGSRRGTPSPARG